MLFQKVIVQIAIISEKSLEIFGAVIKSPFLPIGFFFYVITRVFIVKRPVNEFV